MESQFTERELAVLQRFAQRQSNSEIARDLALTVGTVKWYAQQIFNKLGVSDRQAAVARAQSLGLFADPQATTAPAHAAPNLPAQVTAFLGRQQDLAQVRHLLEKTRLLTITGPGGVGKTRLALRVAHDCLPHFAHGVYWVSLFAVSDPQFVVRAIADALGVRERVDYSLRQSVEQFLAPRHTLLLLDNFEHLLPATPILPALLAAAPRLQMIVTSRALLEVAGEQEYALPPLALPDPTQALTVAQMGDYAAVALFVQRAQAVKPTFALTAENASLIAAICQRLDGLPLAIELAAARSKLFAPAAMLARLDKRLTTLSNHLLDQDGRQRTLRETIDWSYALLTPTEQQLFNRLICFVGGCSLAAIDALCSDIAPEAILNGLASLTNKSLLRQEEDVAGEPRFVMLQTLREYATEQLQATPAAAEECHRCHAAYFLHYLHKQTPQVLAGDQQGALAAIALELDNIRVAWTHATRRGDDAALLQAALPFCWFLDARGYYQENLTLLEEAITQLDVAQPTDQTTLALAHLHLHRGWANVRLGALSIAHAAFTESDGLYNRLQQPPPPGLGTDPLIGLAELANIAGHYADADCLSAEVIAVATVRGDDHNLANALYVRTSAALASGAYRAAEAYGLQAAALLEKIGNRLFLAEVLNLLGKVAYAQGDYATAQVRYQSSYAIQQRFNETSGMAAVLVYLAQIAGQAGEFAAAQEQLTQSLALYRAINDQGGIATALKGLGSTAVAQGALLSAVNYFAEALQIALTMNFTSLLLAILTEVSDLWLRLGYTQQAQTQLLYIVTHSAAEQATRQQAEGLLATLAPANPTLANPTLANPTPDNAKNLAAMAQQALAALEQSHTGIKPR